MRGTWGCSDNNKHEVCAVTTSHPVVLRRERKNIHRDVNRTILMVTGEVVNTSETLRAACLRSVPTQPLKDMLYSRGVQTFHPGPYAVKYPNSRATHSR